MAILTIEEKQRLLVEEQLAMKARLRAARSVQVKEMQKKYHHLGLEVQAAARRNKKILKTMKVVAPLVAAAVGEVTEVPAEQVEVRSDRAPTALASHILGKWKADRQRARTDLLWLCNEVLDYPDVSLAVHGDILAGLQHFEGGTDVATELLHVARGPKDYTPAVSMWELEGCRKNLILFPRGHLKTTCEIAHTIQWIINYPDVRILISSGTEKQTNGFVSEIKGHFVGNEKFRFLFPEFCPPAGKSKEFGSQDKFTVPCRKKHRKEPTISSATVGMVLAGGHYDVQKHDDLVDKQNCLTVGQIEEVKYHFGMMTPLLETSEIEPGHGWQDVSGTPYNFADLYQVLRESEEAKPLDQRKWNLIIRSAAPNWPDGPYLWPERMGYQALKDIEDDPVAGPAVLFAQYLMNPIPIGVGLIDDPKEIIWTPRKTMNSLYAGWTLMAALDLAGMDTGAKGADNDYTCLTIGGFGRDGRLYIPEIRHGRPDVFQVIEWIFEVFDKHPRLQVLKMEKEAHARVLLPFLQKEMARRNKWLPITAMPRDNQQSKKQKIRGIQPWLKQGQICFADDLPCRTNLINEIMRFPKFVHDDILDTLVDLWWSKHGVTGDVMGRPKQGIDGPLKPLEAMELRADLIFGENETAGGIEVMTGW